MEQTVHDGQTEDAIRTGKIKIAILIFVVTVILKGTHGHKHITIFHACFGMTVVFHGNQHRLLNRHSSQGNCPSSNPTNGLRPLKALMKNLKSIKSNRPTDYEKDIAK